MLQTKPTAAIYLSCAQRTAELTAGLAAEGVDAFTAGTSDEFHQIINRQRVDALVVEHQLPGFLTGLELLERLHQDLLSPPTVLLGVLTPEEQPRAREIGVDQLLRPTETIGTLAGAVKGLITAGRHAPVLIPAAARKLVAQADVIRPLPQLLTKLSTYLEDAETSTENLAQDIAVDPKITAELLKLVNSSALGLRRKITRISEAVTLLGVRRTVSLVVSSSVIRSQGELLKPLPDELRTWYHSRSVLIASTADAFAQRLEEVSPDTADLLGLLQNTGILVLAHAFGERYFKLLYRARDIPQVRLEVCEQEDLRLTHADVSAALLQKWGLPPSLISLVADHHNSAALASGPKSAQRFLHLMHIGEAVANLADRFATQRHVALGHLLAAYGPERHDQCRSCLAEAVAKAAESAALFSLPLPDEEALRRMVARVRAADAPGGADDAAPPTDAAPSESGGPQRRPALLVVEDDPITVELIRAYLTAYDVEVYSGDSPQAAREHIGSVQAVLCDVHLGEFSGIALVRNLRQAGCALPVLMMSMDRTRETVEQCIAAGISDYLVKPLTRERLLNALAQHVRLVAATCPV